MLDDLETRYLLVEHLWATQNWPEWTTTCSPAYVFSPGIGPDRDLQATLDWSRGMFTAFPDLEQTVERVVQDGRHAIGTTVARATHTGPLDLGLGRVLAPTRRNVEFPYVKVLTFDADGLVAHDRQYFDHVAFLAQLT